jgi:hypothetical protein
MGRPSLVGVAVLVVVVGAVAVVRAVVGSCCRRRPPVTIIGSAGKKDVGFELVVMTHLYW